MGPTDHPVTLSILMTWYRKHPEFGMIYEKDGQVVGVCIVIALTAEGWQKLTNGNIAEAAVGEEHIFDSRRGDKAIGLHFYHMEKLSDSFGCFHEQAFRDLHKLISSLPGGDVRIAGLSALAVTPGGLWLFDHKLNFRERD